MTVKSRRGRRRYVVFTVPSELTREACIKAIPGGKTFNVIQCAEGMAIVRCSPDNIGKCGEAMRAVTADAEIITVSGTLKTLRDRYPILRRNAPPKPSKAPAPRNQSK